MKKRIILAEFSICIALFTGCGVETVHALEPMQTVEETEVIATETMEATELEGAETDVVAFLESTEMPDETVSITDADYIAMAKECEQEFKILDGEEYDCEIAIDLRGCIYVYEFPEEHVKAEECSLFFSYDEAKIIKTSEGKLIEIPVLIHINENKYHIGIADFIPDRKVQRNSLLIDEIIFYYEDYRDRLSYEIFSEKADELKPAIIRNYNPEDRSVELCYVTAIDYDTYTDYKIENEEWISIPLSEDAKIVAWSWGNTCAAFVSEEVLDNAVEEWLNFGYFFATIYEGDGYVQGIAQIFNP